MQLFVGVASAAVAHAHADFSCTSDPSSYAAGPPLRASTLPIISRRRRLPKATATPPDSYIWTGQAAGCPDMWMFPTYYA